MTSRSTKLTLIVLLALAMMGIVRIPMLYREKRFHLSRDWGIWSACTRLSWP